VVAIAPYGVLSHAVLNICRDYASFVPRMVIRAGLKQLPVVLDVQADELDTTTVLTRHPVSALFVSGAKDKVIPPADMQKLFNEALPESELIVVPGATHETVTYHFSEILPPVLAWLNTSEPGRH
jgi:pimeloyl-ACP methyl ester carboxylesterase